MTRAPRKVGRGRLSSDRPAALSVSILLFLLKTKPRISPCQCAMELLCLNGTDGRLRRKKISKTRKPLSRPPNSNPCHKPFHRVLSGNLPASCQHRTPIFQLPLGGPC